jgi:lipopolysaccharide transport system ATP-binding protein
MGRIKCLGLSLAVAGFFPWLGLRLFRKMERSFADLIWSAPPARPMSDIVIAAENLSKSYLLGHQSAERERYTALRDVITREAHNFARKGLDFIRGRQIVHGDEVEEFWALRDVTFEAMRGEVLGIIGRNGAGKSTLLKILSRITEPTRGRVTIRGRVSSLLEVGTGFHPELTGRENIYLNGAILGMTQREIHKKFDEIIAFAAVEQFIDTPVKRYSSGMSVRLAFAVAAHLEPEILIVDEVLAVGDVEFQKKCLGKMDDVSTREGRTVLLVSHNMSALSRLCQTAIWLDGGLVRGKGPTQDIVSQYLHNNGPTGIKYVDLGETTRPRSVEDDRIRIQSLEWLSELPLRHGEPMAARIGFRSKGPICALSLGIGFSSREGTRVVTYSTDLTDMNRPDLGRPGYYSAEVKVEALPLQPEDYDINIYARSGDLHLLDFVGADRVEVAAGPKTPAFMTSKFAGARLPSTWSWNCEPTRCHRPQSHAADCNQSAHSNSLDP